MNYPLTVRGSSAAVSRLGLFAFLFSLILSMARAEEFKRFTHDGVNPAGVEYPNVTWTIEKGSAGPGYYSVGLVQPGYNGIENYRYAHVDINGVLRVYNMGNSLVPATSPAIGYGMITNGYTVRSETRASAGIGQPFNGQLLDSKTYTTFTWAANMTTIPYVPGGGTVAIPREFVIYLKPAPKVLFYLPYRNYCGESRPIYLQVGNLVQATGSTTTPPTEGINPPLYTETVERDAAVGMFFAWIVGTKPVYTGTITKAQMDALKVEPELEVAITCPDTDGDGVEDADDEDDDGDGKPDGELDTPDTPPSSTPPPGTNSGPGAPAGSGGTAPPPPGTNKPPPTPGGGGIGTGQLGNVNVSNTNDFYEPIKRAFEDAGNGNGFFPPPGNNAPFGVPNWTDTEPKESKAPIDAVRVAKETAALAEQAAKMGIGALASSANAKLKPATVNFPDASESSWQVPVPLAYFGVSNFDIDLQPLHAPITIFRTLVKWLLVVIAWFKFWNYFRSMITTAT